MRVSCHKQIRRLAAKRTEIRKCFQKPRLEFKLMTRMMILVEMFVDDMVDPLMHKVLHKELQKEDNYLTKKIHLYALCQLYTVVNHHLT